MGLFSDVPTSHILAVLLGSLEIVLFGGVVFGWHSVVYVYKDVGYFREDCPSQGATSPQNSIKWQYVQPGNVSFSSPLSPSMTNGTGFNGTHGAFPSSTASFGLGTNSSGDGDSNSIHFDKLTCKEKLKVHSQGGVSQVCESQDEQFNLVFSLSTGINGILSFPSGFLYDRVGTRISRIISIISFMFGQFCLIFASSSNPYLLYPGFTGLVYGGYQILLTNLQLSCLIPSLRSTIMSLYSGSYDTSSSIFLLFKAAHEGGVSINTMFAIQATLFFVIFSSSTFCLLPRGRVPSPLYPGYHLQCRLCQLFSRGRSVKARETFTSTEWEIDLHGSIIRTRGFGASRDNLGEEPVEVKEVKDAAESDAVKTFEVGQDGEFLSSGDDCPNAPEAEGATGPNNTHPQNGQPSADGEGKSMLRSGQTKEKRKTFCQVALSSLFLTDLLWLSVQRLRSWIFVGMFNPWITRLACGDKHLVSHYTSVYAGMQFFGILTAPLSGRLMDRKIKGAEKYGNPRYERLHASIASFVLNSTVSVLLTICTLIPVLKLQYLTFFLHCLHRSFLYGPNSAFVANGFPNEHFGKLFGVTLTTSAAFSMLQYPLFLIMQGPLEGDPLAINIFLLVLMIISYVHPLNIWRYLKKKRAKCES